MLQFSHRWLSAKDVILNGSKWSRLFTQTKLRVQQQPPLTSPHSGRFLVTFIPMLHVGTSAFYDTVLDYVQAVKKSSSSSASPSSDNSSSWQQQRRELIVIVEGVSDNAEAQDAQAAEWASIASTPALRRYVADAIRKEKEGIVQDKNRGLDSSNYAQKEQHLSNVVKSILHVPNSTLFSDEMQHEVTQLQQRVMEATAKVSGSNSSSSLVSSILQSPITSAPSSELHSQQQQSLRGLYSASTQREMMCEFGLNPAVLTAYNNSLVKQWQAQLQRLASAAKEGGSSTSDNNSSLDNLLQLQDAYFTPLLATLAGDVMVSGDTVESVLRTGREEGLVGGSGGRDPSIDGVTSAHKLQKQQQLRLLPTHRLKNLREEICADLLYRIITGPRGGSDGTSSGDVKEEIETEILVLWGHYHTDGIRAALESLIRQDYEQMQQFNDPSPEAAAAPHGTSKEQLTHSPRSQIRIIDAASDAQEREEKEAARLQAQEDELRKVEQHPYVVSEYGFLEADTKVTNENFKHELPLRSLSYGVPEGILSAGRI